jgi:hypothetical protein
VSLSLSPEPRLQFVKTKQTQALAIGAREDHHARQKPRTEKYLIFSTRSTGDYGGDYGASALNSSSSFIEIVGRSVSDSLHRENGGFRRRWRTPNWRATADENGHYCFAVVL